MGSDLRREGTCCQAQRRGCVGGAGGVPPELWVPALGGEPGPAAAEERHTRPMEVRSSKLHGAPAGLRHRLPSEWAGAYTD